MKLRSSRTGRPVQGGEDRRCVETSSSGLDPISLDFPPSIYPRVLLRYKPSTIFEPGLGGSAISQECVWL